MINFNHISQFETFQLGAIYAHVLTQYLFWLNNYFENQNWYT
jgi:hypothetical protein